MPSFQEILRSRQAGGFIGREQQLTLFASNLRLPAADRQFLFSVHGAAGIGKSFLVRQFRRIAVDHGCAVGHVDESAYDLPSALEALAAGLGPCKEFAKRLAAYRQHRQDLDSDPAAPEGLSSLLTRSTVRASLAAAGEVPVVGSLAKAIDAKSAAEDVDKLRVFLSRKLRSRDDVQLVMSPADVLTPALVNDLNALKQPVALFFDTYERTSPFLDQWLRDLFAGKHGDLPADLVFVVAGQKPLDLNQWGDFLSVRTDLPLEVFTDDEARRFLTSRNVTDPRVVDVILGLSGRLPVLVAMLAEAHPSGVSEVGDPSGSAVERFLKWEPDPARRTAALFGALPRKFSTEEFAIAAGSADHLSWLVQQPFVTEQADGYHYHDVVRSQMLRVLQRRSPAEWRSRHLALADHAEPLEQAYHNLCANGSAALPEALTGLITAFSKRRSLAPQWAQMILQAGREKDTLEVTRRGAELVNTVDYTALIGLLVEDRTLTAAVRALAHAERGVLLRARRDFTAALADFETALALAPDKIRYVGERGETLRRMNRPAEAVPELDRLLAQNPDDSWARGCRGAALQALGRLDAALADLDAAIGLRPNYIWALGARAETLRRMGRQPEALADLEQALEQSPDYVYGLALRSRILLEMGEVSSATEDMKHAIELESQPDLSLMRRRVDDWADQSDIAMRVLNLWAEGRKDEAVEEVRAALSKGSPLSSLIGEFRGSQDATFDPQAMQKMVDKLLKDLPVSD